MVTKSHLTHLITAVLFIANAAVMLTPEAASAQTFGQFMTAVIASEGEGGFFVITGGDQFRTGAMARFQINRKSDFGIQAGFDRLDGLNSTGLGGDYKYYLLGEESTIPVDMAVGISFGHLRAEDRSRSIIGFAFLTSGTLTADTKIPVEPYASIGIYTTFLHNGDICANAGPSCHDDDRDTEMILLGGTKIILSDEYQLLFEIKLDGKISFGAAINMVF